MYDLQKGREYILIASEEPDLTPEEEYEFYAKYALRTKEDLIAEIKENQRSIHASSDKTRSEEFYQRLDRLFNNFCEEIDSHVLMEPLDNFWGYAFEVRETGISLMLDHFMILYDYVGDDYPESWKYSSSHYLAEDDQFPLIEVRAKLLTLEEYGHAYGVGAGTVRQWIRRGKLRSAAKFGNEWRVPELAEKRGRGYSSGQFYWKTDLPDPPVEIPNINEADSLYIYKNLHTGEWIARLACYFKKGTDWDIVIDNKAKEKLELYMISHPLVECLDNNILDVRQKKGSHYKMMKLVVDEQHMQED